MKLAAYLEKVGLSDADFGLKIGVNRQSVHRYKTGERIPDTVIMPRIVAETGGEVTPNDFYGVPTAPDLPHEEAVT